LVTSEKKRRQNSAFSLLLRKPCWKAYWVTSFFFFLLFLAGLVSSAARPGLAEDLVALRAGVLEQCLDESLADTAPPRLGDDVEAP